jgi:Bifunctional DNA primase/polymerase, N-terminal
VTTADNPFLAAALACVARGWHVIPLWPGTKKPVFHGYDRCPHTGICAERHQTWEMCATNDPDKVGHCWTHPRYHRCNVGIATGPSGLVGIDLDVAKPDDDPRPAEWDRPDITNGRDVFLAVCKEAGQEPPAETFIVRTASGGYHLYYAAPAGAQLRNTAGTALGWKVDTRCWGGQLVGPGSIVGGRDYRVVRDVAPMPLPAWLCDKLAAPPPAPPAPPVRTRNRSAYVDAAVRDTIAQVRAVRVSRNAALYGAAVSLGQLVGPGQLSEQEHHAALIDAAGGHIAVGAYSARQAEQTIASGLRKGMLHPRQVAA